MKLIIKEIMCIRYARNSKNEYFQSVNKIKNSFHINHLKVNIKLKIVIFIH